MEKLSNITIEGTTAWCNPFEPNTSFDKPHGVYDVAIVVEQERAEQLCEYLDQLSIQKLDEVIKEAPANKKTVLADSLSINKAGSPARDANGTPTGDILFKAKLKPIIEKKDGTTYTQKVAVFDASLQPITSPIKVTRGSHVKVVLEPYPYMMQSTKQVGVSLRFQKLQIIKLAEDKEDTGGLEAVEGGYVANAVAKDDSKEDFDPTSADTSDDQGDF